ncbi:MAG: hypothetical protein ISQ44_04525 [Cryomorphaceae bacterium]|nr:hypothetical protein [Cryomorphaceae bacterium]
MEKKLYTYALAFISVIVLLSIIWPYEHKLIDWQAPADYSVLESDEIFFNNTRIYKYRTDERAELTSQGFKTHRSLKYLKDTTMPFLNFSIVNNWRADQAYIVAEPGARKFFRDTVTIRVDAVEVKIYLDKMDFEQHYQLAALLFQNALDYHRPFIIEGQDSLLLYGTQGNENANIEVLKDYFRLVGRFQ